VAILFHEKDKLLVLSDDSIENIAEIHFIFRDLDELNVDIESICTEAHRLMKYIPPEELLKSTKQYFLESSPVINPDMQIDNYYEDNPRFVQSGDSKGKRKRDRGSLFEKMHVKDLVKGSLVLGALFVTSYIVISSFINS